MSRRCEACGRGSMRGARRSHSKVKVLKRQNVNLQKIDGKKICSRCFRTMAKESR